MPSRRVGDADDRSCRAPAGPANALRRRLVSPHGGVELKRPSGAITCLNRHRADKGDDGPFASDFRRVRRKADRGSPVSIGWFPSAPHGSLTGKPSGGRRPASRTNTATSAPACAAAPRVEGKNQAGYSNRANRTATHHYDATDRCGLHSLLARPDADLRHHACRQLRPWPFLRAVCADGQRARAQDRDLGNAGPGRLSSRRAWGHRNIAPARVPRLPFWRLALPARHGRSLHPDDGHGAVP